MLDTDDILAIHQLLARYGHYVDRRHGEGMAEIFTDDAVKETTASEELVQRLAEAGRPVDVLRSRQVGLPALKEWFSQDFHPPGHNVTSIYVYEDGGDVRAASKWVVVDPATGRAGTGDYADVLTSTPDGWRISYRLTTVRQL